MSRIFKLSVRDAVEGNPVVGGRVQGLGNFLLLCSRSVVSDSLRPHGPNYFIVFVAKVNRIYSLISLSGFSLLV